MRVRRMMGASVVLAACALLQAAAAQATFPGRNGMIALPVNHIPYVIGIARINPNGRAWNVENAKTSFLFGCKIDVQLDVEPCVGGAPNPGYAGRPSISADGRWVAFDHGNLDFVRTDGRGFRELAPLTLHDSNASWFPDGQRVAFTGELTGGTSRKPAIFTVRIDGTRLRRLTARGDDAAVSPNGRLIAFDRPGRGGHADVWLMRSDGSGQRRLISGGSNPCFSPGGAQLVFAGVERGGRSAIERVDVSGANRTVLARNGDYPVWSPDGKLIAYSSNDVTSQPDESDLWLIPAGGGTRRRIAYDNPISEDQTGFDVPDWQSLGGKARANGA